MDILSHTVHGEWTAGIRRRGELISGGSVLLDNPWSILFYDLQLEIHVTFWVSISLLLMKGKKPAGKKEGEELVLTVDVYQRAIEGDRAAIEKICLDTWEPLYRFIYYKVQNREEAEDITQETYVKSLKYLQKSTFPPENFLAFMKTVALNLIRDRWRQKKRAWLSVNFQEINLADATHDNKENEIAQRLLLEGALAKLSREQQAIIDLRIIKGYSVAETAKLLGKTEGAVRTAQYRALKALIKILDESAQKGQSNPEKEGEQ